MKRQSIDFGACTYLIAIANKLAGTVLAFKQLRDSLIVFARVEIAEALYGFVGVTCSEINYLSSLQGPCNIDCETTYRY